LLAFTALVAIVVVVGLIPPVVSIVGPPHGSSTPSASPAATVPPSAAPEEPAEAPSPSTGPTEWSETFVSERFGYSIRYPAGWHPVPTPDGSLADTITAPEPSTVRLSIVRRPATPGATFAEMAETMLPHRAQPDGCHWASGIIFIPAAQATFHEMKFSGRRALVRSECSVVDAILDLGDEVLIVVLRSERHMPTGDGYTFASFASTLAVADVVDGVIPTP
jgi:hypothetical protein